mgnify:CR=1 FL=1
MTMGKGTHGAAVDCKAGKLAGGTSGGRLGGGACDDDGAETDGAVIVSAGAEVATPEVGPLPDW